MSLLSHLRIGRAIAALVALLVGATGILVWFYEIVADFGRDDQGGATAGSLLRGTASLTLIVSSCMDLAFATRVLRRLDSATSLGIWAQLALVLASIVRIDATLQRQPYDIYLRWGLVLVAVFTLGYLLISSLLADHRGVPTPGQTNVMTHGPSPILALLAGVAITLGILGVLGGLALILIGIFVASGISLSLAPTLLTVGSAAELIFGIAMLQRKHWGWKFGVLAQALLIIATLLFLALGIGLLWIVALIPAATLVYLVSRKGRETFDLISQARTSG